jgi:thiol-disulfide isomerase/thioredoxin
VSIDLSPPKPYVPPTPAQLTGQSFAARKEKTPREKLDYLLIEAKREYTRPLLLFGSPKDPACIDLFRLFDEQSANVDEAKGKLRVKTPGDLRWEFELSSLDTAQADVETFAKELSVPLDDGKTPMLAVLSDDSKLSATFLLRLDADKKLDGRALGAFLLEHKLPTRDAETMLLDGLAKAKAENKRVFLIMSASWCGPCRMLARFLVANKAELERHYVFVKLDISRDTRVGSLKEKYEGKDASNGVPWYVILDAAGEPLITSNAKELAEESSSTNIGFPSSKEGIDHFLKMLKETAPRLSDEALDSLRKGLSTKP